MLITDQGMVPADAIFNTKHPHSMQQSLCAAQYHLSSRIL